MKLPHLSRRRYPLISAVTGTWSCPSGVLGGLGGPIHSLRVLGGRGVAVAGRKARMASRTRSKPTTRLLRAGTDFGRHDGLHGGLQLGHQAQGEQRPGGHLHTPPGTSDRTPAWGGPRIAGVGGLHDRRKRGDFSICGLSADLVTIPSSQPVQGAHAC